MPDTDTLDLATVTSRIDTHLAAYGEPDADLRSSLIAEVWDVDGSLVDPPLDATGHAGIVEMAATVQSAFPGRVRRTSGVDLHHGVARYEWELVAPDGAVSLTGIDIADLASDGRLQRVVGFLGPIPAKEA